MATRRERVVLELEDNFTSGMARAAAAAALLDKNLDSLSGSSVQTSRDADKVKTSIKGVGDEVDKTSAKTRRGSADINQYSGRLRLLTEAAVVLGPALVPIGAVAVPATLALAAGLGAAAGAAGVAVLAFNGVGDALGALDDYQLAPTAANLEKMNEAMAAVGPAGSSFVMFLDSLEPQLKQVQELARLGLLPGAEAGLASLMTMLPQVRELVFSLSTAVGELAADAGAALAGDAWRPFFDYLQTDAAPTLTAFAHSLGNVGQGLGSLLVAFAPLSSDFASGMEAMTASFADWAAGLSETEGFRSFVAYVRESGPQVLALLGSLASAMVDIAVAAAPVAAAVLPALTAMAKILSVIASSPIGPPLFTAAAAMLALSRATTLANAAMVKFSASSAAGAANLSKLGAGLNLAAILAGIYGVDKAMDEAFGDNAVDTATLLDKFGGKDAAAELDKIGVSLKNINSSAGEATDKVFGFIPGDTTWGEARDNIEEIDQALAQLQQSGNAEQAAELMQSIVAAAEEQGVSTAEATKWFEEYNAALADTSAADDAAAAQKRYADAASASARVNQISRAQIQGLTEAMEEQTNAALGAFDAVTRYARALEAAQQRAKHTKAGLDETTEAGRKNRDLMREVAAAWNSQGKAIANNMGKWREARANFIQTAVDMGATRREARALADDILDIPKQRVIDIKLYGSEQAADQIERVRREMATLKDKTVRLTYYVNQVNSINRRASGGGAPVPQAGGGFVPKTGLPYADRHPYLLADGEGVTTNRRGETDRFRDVIEGINAGFSRSQVKGMLANGGIAGAGIVGFGASAGIGSALTISASAHAASDALFNLAGLGKKELEIRQRLLQKEIEREEKAVSLAREHRNAVLDDMKSLRESIANRFKSDLFAQQQQSDFTLEMPQSFNSAADAQAWYAAQQKVRNAQNSATQSPVDILRADIAEGQEANGLYRQLARIYRKSGGKFTAAERQALTYAQLNADNPALAGLVGDPRMAQQYADLYGDRNRVSNAAGNTAAMQRYGVALDRSNAHLSDVKAELRESKAIQKQMERRLERIEKNTHDGPDKTARGVGREVNGAAAAGHNGREPA